MTCEELAQRLEAWRNGSLPEGKARALEQHAADCVSCYAMLDQASRPANIPSRIPPPEGLREATLAAVRRRRLRSRATMSVTLMTGVAALVLLAWFLRPGRKLESDFPGARLTLVATDHARPSLAALDAAESEVEDALQTSPDDPALSTALARIRQARDDLSQLIGEIGS